jgi:hypothetical protein
VSNGFTLVETNDSTGSVSNPASQGMCLLKQAGASYNPWNDSRIAEGVPAWTLCQNCGGYNADCRELCNGRAHVHYCNKCMSTARNQCYDVEKKARY